MTDPLNDSSQSNEPSGEPSPQGPSRHDRLRPLELVGFAGVLALFTGLVVFYVIQGWQSAYGWTFAGVSAGVVFIIVLITVALLGLGAKPSDEDVEARRDLKSPDTDNWH